MDELLHRHLPRVPREGDQVRRGAWLEGRARPIARLFSAGGLLGWCALMLVACGLAAASAPEIAGYLALRDFSPAALVALWALYALVKGVHEIAHALAVKRWGGDARAYLGITVPEFPNLFLMYGPNTNIVVNGSIIFFSECEAHYIVESVRMLLERGRQSMDCRAEVHDRYNERIDAGNRGMAWGAADVNTWYTNEFGRSAQNWPFNLLTYWRQTRAPDPDDYVLS